MTQRGPRVEGRSCSTPAQHCWNRGIPGEFNAPTRLERVSRSRQSACASQLGILEGKLSTDGLTVMDTRQLRENRAAFPAADLAKYRGQWVAFSMDGRRIIAAAPELVELDALLLAMGENPKRVALEYIDTDPSFVTGPETV